MRYRHTYFIRTAHQEAAERDVSVKGRKGHDHHVHRIMVDIHPHQRIRFSHQRQSETIRSRPRVYRSSSHHRPHDPLQAEEGLRGRTSGIASGRSHGTDTGATNIPQNL